MTKWMDKISHSIFEDEPVKAATPAPSPPHPPAPEPHPAPAPGIPITHTEYTQLKNDPHPVQLASALVSGSSAYEMLRSKTSFEDSETGVELAKYLKPLESLPLDERMKLKSAMAQASAQSGLTVERLLATFDGLKQNLQHEIQKFHDFATAQTDSEVTTRTQQMEEIKGQIEKLQQQLIQLSSEKANEEGKVAHARSEFEAAVSTRNAELDQQKAHYASLLAG